MDKEGLLYGNYNSTALNYKQHITMFLSREKGKEWGTNAFTYLLWVEFSEASCLYLLINYLFILILFFILTQGNFSIAVLERKERREEEREKHLCEGETLMGCSCTHLDQSIEHTP